MLTAFLDDVRHSSPGKLWQPRAALLLICAWIFWRHLGDPLYGGLVKGLNLGVHELGHYVFAFLGEFMAVAGGTILQLVVPLVAFWMFYKQRDYFAIAIAFCWLGTNLFDVAAYAADARARELPLVSPGSGDPEHDWFYMLLQTNLLSYDKTIGGLFRGLGMLSFAAGLAFGFWVIQRMRAPRSATS